MVAEATLGEAVPASKDVPLAEEGPGVRGQRSGIRELVWSQAGSCNAEDHRLAAVAAAQETAGLAV